MYVFSNCAVTEKIVGCVLLCCLAILLAVLLLLRVLKCPESLPAKYEKHILRGCDEDRTV